MDGLFKAREPSAPRNSSTVRQMLSIGRGKFPETKVLSYLSTAGTDRFSPETVTGTTRFRRGVESWPGAQPQLKAIAHQALQRPALHAVAAVVATAVIATTAATGLTLPRLILRRLAAEAAVAAVALAAAQGRVGRDPARPFRTRLPKYSRSRQFVNPLRKQR